MEKTFIKKVKSSKTYCDDCGKELHWSLQCSVTQCEYCGKDLCEKCIACEIDTCYDYREVYCKECWEIAKPYHEKISELENEIEKLYEECKQKCKDKRNE